MRIGTHQATLDSIRAQHQTLATGLGIPFDGLLDAIYVLNWQFIGGPVPPCMDAADADDNGIVDGLLDGLVILNFQFTMGAPPPPPYPNPGVDPTPDSVDCANPAP